MVSLRCKMAVKNALEKMGLLYKYIDLGEIDLIENSLTPEQHTILQSELHKSGLELMDDNKSVLVERTKNIIVELIHYSDELPKHKISAILSKQLNQSYAFISNLFKEVTGTTIQHFMLLHKIEKVKELILYDELNLTEISYKLHYSSVAHLSNQFKQITGLTPTYFKKIHSYKKRLMLESI